MDVA
jgi:hypothetical protein